MQTQWIAELPHAAADKRPWKRQRLGWDVPPPIPSPQVSLSFYCGKEAMHTANSDTQFWQSFYNTGAPQYESPPWRGDDKDGHYIFSVGENLTVRSNFMELGIYARDRIFSMFKVAAIAFISDKMTNLSFCWMFIFCLA